MMEGSLGYLHPQYGIDKLPNALMLQIQIERCVTHAPSRNGQYIEHAINMF